MTRAEIAARKAVLEEAAAHIEGLVGEDGYLSRDLHSCGWDECCADWLPGKLADEIRLLGKRKKKPEPPAPGEGAGR